MRGSTKAIVCGIAVSCAATLTQASTIALGFGGGVSYSSTHTMTPGLNIYDIGGPDEGFYFDPNAGGWEKQLLAPSNGFIPGEIYCINEWFTFCQPPAGGPPGFPLEDWHEEISFGPDGGIWDVWVTDLGDPTISFDSGEIVPGLQFMISADGTGLWFDFDPIDVGPEGVTLHISKYFRYTGPTVSFDPVIITQYPTPTPGTLALMGFAGLLMSRRTR